MNTFFFSFHVGMFWSCITDKLFNFLRELFVFIICHIHRDYNLIVSSKLRIVLHFEESYVVLYPLQSIFLLPTFRSYFLIFSSWFITSVFSMPSEIKFIIDGDCQKIVKKFINDDCQKILKSLMLWLILLHAFQLLLFSFAMPFRALNE